VGANLRSTLGHLELAETALRPLATRSSVIVVARSHIVVKMCRLPAYDCCDDDDPAN
jgi:hypothetical protein